MNLNEQTTEEMVVEKKSKLPLLLIILSVAVLLVVLVVSYFYIMNEKTDPAETATESAEFTADITTYGNLMDAGKYQEARVAAQTLLANSTTDHERGRANLSLGLAEQNFDKAAAVERFKATADNEAFHPFVRAMGIWYALQGYFGSRDITVARDQIFTGETWSEYVDEAYADDPDLMYRMAAIAALQASLDIQISPQVAMRLANEYTAILRDDQSTDAYKEELVSTINGYITLADQELVEIKNQNNSYYTGSEYVVEISVLNNKALALDTMYVDGYIEERSKVLNAYKAALEAVNTYSLKTSHPYYVRYNYADFLARNDLENSESTIVRLLQPMATLTSDHLFTHYIVNHLQSSSDVFESPARYSGNPETIRLLATVSPEFKSALLRSGVPESDLDASIVD